MTKVQEIYQRDFDAEYKGAQVFVQHKGTDLCGDFHCVCGTIGHIDGDFVYKVRCKECDRVYAVGQVLKLIQLSHLESEEIPHDAILFSNDE